MKNLPIILLFFAVNAFAMNNDSLVKPPIRTSPIAIAQLKSPEKKYYMKATYGQPLRKNRIIFGENGLVPYNKLWRTGANEATEITFTQAVKFGEQEIQAGSYTLFSVPSEKHWTVILNTELGQWGLSDYDSTKNIYKNDFIVEHNADIYEGFTIEFKEQGNGAMMNILWDTVKLNIPISFIAPTIVETTGKKKKKRK